jgi:hypothetical protein
LKLQRVRDLVLQEVQAWEEARALVEEDKKAQEVAARQADESLAMAMTGHMDVYSADNQARVQGIMQQHNAGFRSNSNSVSTTFRLESSITAF